MPDRTIKAAEDAFVSMTDRMFEVDSESTRSHSGSTKTIFSATSKPCH